MALDLLRMQKEQYRHDMRNHFDILCLSKQDRLKHYGLHFAKYVGRLARGPGNPQPFERTLVDTFLVCLSAANTLHQKLQNETEQRARSPGQLDPLYAIADASGRFADACEKIDHLEEFVPMALTANGDIVRWTLNQAAERSLDMVAAVAERRKELAAKQFYVEE